MKEAGGSHYETEAFLLYAGRHCRFLLDCSCLLLGFGLVYHSSKGGLI